MSYINNIKFFLKFIKDNNISENENTTEVYERFLKDLEENEGRHEKDECPVCYETYLVEDLVECDKNNHISCCGKCLYQLQEPKCPICREDFDLENFGHYQPPEPEPEPEPEPDPEDDDSDLHTDSYITNHIEFMNTPIILEYTASSYDNPTINRTYQLELKWTTCSENFYTYTGSSTQHPETPFKAEIRKLRSFWVNNFKNNPNSNWVNGIRFKAIETNENGGVITQYHYGNLKRGVIS